VISRVLERLVVFCCGYTCLRVDSRVFGWRPGFLSGFQRFGVTDWHSRVFEWLLGWIPWV